MSGLDGKESSATMPCLERRQLPVWHFATISWPSPHTSLPACRGDGARSADAATFADPALYISGSGSGAAPLAVAASSARMGKQQMLATLLSNDQASPDLIMPEREGRRRDRVFQGSHFLPCRAASGQRLLCSAARLPVCFQGCSHSLGQALDLPSTCSAPASA